MTSGAIFSELAQCQDCYKCVRACPIKAIRVNSGHAVVVPERCIACGACVSACPSGAKRVRGDGERVERLIREGHPVVASLAPSYRSEFPDLEPWQLVASLKALGFAAVSETALGAEQVSAHLASLLDHSEGGIFLSTACPSAVDLVRKYHPDLVPRLTPLASPLQAHVGLLRAHYGEDITVVFLGPCIAKKQEVDETDLPLASSLVAALTFEELRAWMTRRQISPMHMEPLPGPIFEPRTAAEGALYPMEGGMARATALSLTQPGTEFIALSGIDHIHQALQTLPEPGSQNLFLELLTCEGGCICGPKSACKAPVASQLHVLRGSQNRAPVYPRKPEVPADRAFRPDPPLPEHPSEVAVRGVLQSLGKRGAEDELNCSACGYETCRELACAILASRAETRMCVSNMRRQAEKKANALLRTLPFGVVVVDADLRIIESNDQFVRLLGEDAWLIHESQPGLAGAGLEKCLDFADRFREVLESGEEIIRKDIRSGGLTLSTTIFTVEPHRVVGALLHDVTAMELRHRQIIQKAEEVIQNTLANAQEIAFSLGKNAARSEGILNSIIAEFAGELTGETEGGGHASRL